MKILQKAGADLVLLPFQDAAKEAARELRQKSVTEKLGFKSVNPT
jgi:Trk K+ transport system NAD-binding subunit